MTAGAHLSLVTVLVRDYDEAIGWYARLPGFALVEDTPLGGGKRWVVVGPQHGTRLLLARAEGPDQKAATGNQAGGRVAFFLTTENFARDHAAMHANGVRFAETP
ncbi:MAG TPA: VOC family protein, partial [Rhizobiaceae bacterium]|nr:VOC family protein [Rhizobiaceae bacterium]